MADKGRALLAAVKAILVTETAAGESLAGIVTYWVDYTNSGNPPRMGSQPPILEVSMQPVTAERITCLPCWTLKRYPIVFSLYTKTAGDSENDSAATLIDAVEDLFINNNLGISDDVLAPQKSYDIPANAPTFDFQVLGGASLAITHIYTDIRST